MFTHSFQGNLDADSGAALRGILELEALRVPVEHLQARPTVRDADVRAPVSTFALMCSMPRSGSDTHSRQPSVNFVGLALTGLYVQASGATPSLSCISGLVVVYCSLAFFSGSSRSLAANAASAAS